MPTATILRADDADLAVVALANVPRPFSESAIPVILEAFEIGEGVVGGLIPDFLDAEDFESGGIGSSEGQDQKKRAQTEGVSWHGAIIGYVDSMNPCENPWIHSEIR